MKKFLFLFLVTNLLIGCAASKPRFKDKPPVWHIEDDQTIPEPKKADPSLFEYAGNVFFTRKLTRFTEPRDLEPAHNVNALDEVADSSWFTNRKGKVTFNDDGPPKLPLTITQGKSEGANPGFFVKDSNGRHFLLKFDTPENPEQKTATSTIVSRIFWAIGYNTPKENVFYFCRKDLGLDPKASYKNELNEIKPYEWKNVDAILEKVHSFKPDCYRALSSEVIQGIPKGGFLPEGVRDDDPNDRIPHEHRRELRALRVFSSWLGHVDVLQDNTLDIYVTENGKKFLKHYLIDFNESLAAYADSQGRLELGWENLWDWEYQPLSTLAVGLWKRPWEYQTETPWKSIGTFSAEHFDPLTWKGAFPYWPYSEMDAADAFWAAKTIMRLDRNDLEAIVKKGKLSDPKAADYLVNTLLERRNKIGKIYLEAVTPLDDFSIRGDKICAVDLSLHYGFSKSGILERVDGNSFESFIIPEKGEICFPFRKEKGYHIDHLKVRGVYERPFMQLHYISDDRPRIVGLIR